MSAETTRYDYLSETLAQDRLLTEVDHLLIHCRSDGSYDPAVLADLKTNLYTATTEAAMPYAVTVTHQPAEETIDEAGRQKRLFMWLGKCAVEVAESGRQFHFSPPALSRVDIEVAEAAHSQDNLRPGRAQVFISPKMSSADAPEDIARQENLATEDQVRVSYLANDEDGREGRRIESLLVRDIPLRAWADMLKDPNNIFGRSFELRDELSALSVMELFASLELPQEVAIEGPLALVGAVLPYIKDEEAYRSVEHQLGRYWKDQDLYKTWAEATAEKWLDFDRALAESLQKGMATLDIRRFIGGSLQHAWNEEGLRLIGEHDDGDSGYTMTRTFAAFLEQAKRNLLLGTAAIATDNEKVTSQMDAQTAHAIGDEINRVRMRELFGLSSPPEIAEANAKLDRLIADQSLDVGGGCAGDIKSAFKKNGSGSEEDKEKWEWKKGLCRIKNCANRPKLTEVGPCQVCRDCQKIFDEGGDPDKVSRPETSPKRRAPNKMFEIISNSRHNRPKMSA